MFFTGFSPAENCVAVASVITHPFRFWESRRIAHAFPFVSSTRDLPGNAGTSETPVADSPAMEPDLFCFAKFKINCAIPRSLRETVCGRTAGNLVVQLSLGTR